MDGCYNLRNPAVKRLMKEAEELRNPTEEYYAQPLEGNLFEWHFTVRGPPNTNFDGGVYHGRITLPPEYPMKPPSIIILTPNGRFEVNKKICLSISGHHPESWQPSWSIRTALLAIIGFMPTHGNGAIGSLDYTPRERQSLAQRSQMWECLDCGVIRDLLKKSTGLKIDKVGDDDKKENSSPISMKMEDDEISPTSDPSDQEVEENVIQETICCNLTEETTIRNQVTSLAAPSLSENVILENSGETPVVRHRAPFSEQNVNHSMISERSNPQENSAGLTSGIFSSTFVWILTFLIVFLLLRRLLTYVNCF